MSIHYISGNDPTAVKQIAEQFGFCLVRGLFTRAEAEALENQLAAEHRARGGRLPDLYSVPSLRPLMTDTRVLGLAHALMGDDLVYYRQTNLLYEATPGDNTHKPFTDFHCDARGTPLNVHEPMQSPFEKIYPAWRFATYFRDYQNHSGGLKLAVGSHLIRYDGMRIYNDVNEVRKLEKGTVRIGNVDVEKIRQPSFELFNVPSQPGDVVIFNLRTFHSAGAVRFSARPALALLPHVERQLQISPIGAQVCAPTPPGCRNAIFFDFAKPSLDADLYIKWCALRVSTNADMLTQFSNDPSSEFQIRNDSLIVAFTLHLDAQLAARGIDTGAGNPLPPDLAAHARTLLALGRSHREFSPHHALLDAAAIAALAGQNDNRALAEVMRSVKARFAAASADLARLRERAPPQALKPMAAPAVA
ncbi:MAG: phytanoyl-CoA dioxygenase family protein [Rhodospirillaceae bacterium]|nr:phytanoyl-CoA dioxygenase family protein [Rhodospirillaceae bacterium]